MTLGGCSSLYLGPLQATVPPLCQEARSQQVSVEGQIEAQTVVAVPQLVENSIHVCWPFWGFPALYTASMVRQEVGQEVTSGIHSSGVNHIILRQIQQKPLCWEPWWEEKMGYKTMGKEGQLWHGCRTLKKPTPAMSNQTFVFPCCWRAWATHHCPLASLDSSLSHRLHLDLNPMPHHRWTKG